MQSKISLLVLSFFAFINLNAQYHLPIEVLGEEGKVVSTQLELDASTASSAQKLWLQVNNLGYEDKGSVRINNGSWYNLNHSSVDMHAAELARGGMAHGGFSTIRFSIPASSWTTGTNTIEFRFNTSDGISMGYRVIKLNLLDGSDNQLLPDDTFSQEDPDTWVAPYTHADSVARGEDLWRNGQIWANYKNPGEKGSWYGYELIGNNTTALNATCADCHTQDGRDLEYFAYSNESITERAKFHGMSEHEGELITSYIRSLSDDGVERLGRPWNPPFQPGKELMGKTIEHWAAGAGLDAVLEEDADMVPYLFPNGTDQEDIRNAFDADVMDDRTELPLAIQFPDWKHWLPIVHPKDAYNKNNWWSTLPDNRNPIKAYETVRAWFENSFDPNNFPSGNTVPQKLREMWTGADGNGGFRKFHEYNRNGCTANHWRTQCGEANQNLTDGIPQELANMSLARLLAVKNFELMTEFELQDKMANVVPDPMEDQPADRQWPSNTYSVFEAPPHFTAITSRYYVGQDERTGHYENTTWYNLQMVLNGGNGMSGGTTPMDFNYHHPFILFATSTSGVNEPLRYVSAVNHMYQMRTWSQSTQPSNAGFRIRFMGPWTMLGSSDSNQEFYDPSYSVIKQLDDIEAGLADKILEAMLLMFLDEAESYDPNTWPREAPHGRNFALDPITKTTADLISIPHTGSPTSGRVTEHFADKMYDIIPRIQQNFNVHCSITNRIAAWSKAVWPNIDFEKFIEASCADEVCTSITPTDGLVYRIRTAAHNKCLSSLDYSGYSVTQQACDYEDDKRWKLESTGDGHFYLKNVETNNYLQSPDGNNGSALIEGTYTGQTNQQWDITASDNCTFTITSVSASMCIDLKSGSSSNGTRFQQYACDPVNDNRQFVFELMTDQSALNVSITSISDGEEGGNDASFIVSLDDSEINQTGSAVTGTIAYSGTSDADVDFDGVYTFEIADGQSQVQIDLSITDDPAVEGTESIIATLSNVQNASVGISSSAFANIIDNDACEDISMGYIYHIRTVHDKCVSSIESNGRAVTQQTCSGSDDDKWLLETASDGYVYLKNIADGTYLSTPDVSDGTALELTAFAGNNNQQWLLTQKSDCSFEITSRLSGKCMDLKGGGTSDGQGIQQWECIQDVNAVNRSYILENTMVTSTELLNELNNTMVVYPNPVTNQLNIELFQQAGEQVQVSLISLDGRIVLRQNHRNTDLIQLDLGQLDITQGTYFLQVEGENSSVTQTVIINRSKN